MAAIDLADALARRKAAGEGSLLVYLMVDAARRRRLPAVARGLADAGVAGVELGVPFSDPIADGPVLQSAAAAALGHGTRWADLLEALDVVVEHLPAAVMTYANPVLRRGLARACGELRAHGGSALILPDVSLDESGPWEAAARRASLAVVQMASPATPVPRVARLASRSTGFLYLVARYGTTGTGQRPDLAALRDRVDAAHRARPALPVLVGFGVRGPPDVRRIRSAHADGAILGSAMEERLRRSPTATSVERFLSPLVRAAA